MARMARASAKPKRRTVALHEVIVRGKGPLRVDRDKGIIHDVKILGLESVNQRRYTEEAIKAGRILYEGVPVYVNHPDKPNDPRDVGEKFGRLMNVRVEKDGLYGDLEYLKSHPDAALITEAAERMPEQFGLSHNAKGDGQDQDGVFVVEQIVEVRSVDVVTEPATTDGLFESVQKMKIKIKQLFEGSWKRYARKCTKRPKLAGYMKKLVEEDAYDVMDDEPGAEEVPADHEEALKDGFEASVAAIVSKCLDGEEDPKECIGKISDLLKAHAKLTSGDDEESDDMEEEEEPEPKEEPKDKDEKEKQEQRIRKIERENTINREARKAGVMLDDDLMESLLHVADDKAIKQLIAREKGKGQGQSRHTAPRSGATGGESRPTMEGVDTPEGFLAALLN